MTHKEEQKIAASLLARVMADLSEEIWCAGWLIDLEYQLWDAVIGKETRLLSTDVIAQLKYLADKCGGWIVWDSKAPERRKFLPMKDWLKRYQEHETRK